MAAAAAPAAPYVPPAAPAGWAHPIDDLMMLRVHDLEKHDGKRETWPAFVLLAQIHCSKFLSRYVLERDRDRYTAGLQANGYYAERIAIDQARVHSALVGAVAHYAAAEITAVPFGSPLAGTAIWHLLCIRHRPEDASSRVQRKANLTQMASNFKHDNIEAYFDSIVVERDTCNQLAGAGGGAMVDDEALVTTIQNGVARDARYAVVISIQ